jgi:DnaK suppressor protein
LLSNCREYTGLLTLWLAKAFKKGSLLLTSEFLTFTLRSLHWFGTSFFADVPSWGANILVMNEQEKQDLRTRIDSAILEMKEKIAQLEEASRPIGPENAIGRVSRMDAINNKSVSEAALRTAKGKLSKLQNALQKLDTPGFGKCRRCGRPIAPARLMYMPESDHCVRCAR